MKKIEKIAITIAWLVVVFQFFLHLILNLVLNDSNILPIGIFTTVLSIIVALTIQISIKKKVNERQKK